MSSQESGVRTQQSETWRAGGVSPLAALPSPRLCGERVAALRGGVRGGTSTSVKVLPLTRLAKPRHPLPAKRGARVRTLLAFWLLLALLTLPLFAHGCHGDDVDHEPLVVPFRLNGDGP